MTQMFADGKGTLNAAGQETVRDGLLVLMESVRANNFEKGWRSDDSPVRPVGELVALLHSEVSEAFEAHRNNEPALWYEHKGKDWKWEGPQTLTDNETGEVTLGKPQGIASELADVLIRLVDMAQEHDIPLIDAVIQKHAYNQTRPWKHGGKAV